MSVEAARAFFRLADADPNTELRLACATSFSAVVAVGAELGFDFGPEALY